MELINPSCYSQVDSRTVESRDVLCDLLHSKMSAVSATEHKLYMNPGLIVDKQFRGNIIAVTSSV